MRTLFPAIWYLCKGPHHVSLNRFGRLESVFYQALGPPLGSSTISETAGRETKVTSRMDENIDTDQKVRSIAFGGSRQRPMHGQLLLWDGGGEQ